MDLKETQWEGVHWMNLVQNKDKWLAVGNTAMNLWVPWNTGNLLTN